MFKPCILILAFTLFPSFLLARVGLADWSCNTPGGNEINNFDDGIQLLILKGNNSTSNNTVTHLGKWFFFKDYIIGQRTDSPNYFVVNEQTGTTYFFTTDSDYNIFTERNNLLPVHVKWYDSDWQNFSSSMGTAIALIVLFIMSVLVLIICFIIKAIFKNRFKLIPVYLVYLIIIGILLLTLYIEDLNPQSF